jgi:hypothetical protein
MDGQRNDSGWLQCLPRYEPERPVRIKADAITHFVGSIYRHGIAIRADLLLCGHGRGFERRRKRVLKPGDRFDPVEFAI